MELGTRVVRGPDWTLSDSESDGGEGFVGTVVEVGGKSSSLPENLVWVQWDSGIRHDHRAGYYGVYDLCVLDTASAGINHPGVSCAACQQMPILGMRWHCLDCPVYNLCTLCYMNDEHKRDHMFERLDKPDFREGVNVGTRIRATRVQAKGIFQGAWVKRGPDWRYIYGSQDGGEGKQGLVKEITTWKKVPRSGVVVSWDNAEQNKYRLCYKGKVDVVCTLPAVGLCYYKHHLPRLGEQQKRKTSNNEKVHSSNKERSRSNSDDGDTAKQPDNHHVNRKQERKDHPRLNTGHKLQAEKAGVSYQSRERGFQETVVGNNIGMRNTKLLVPELKPSDASEVVHCDYEMQWCRERQVPSDLAPSCELSSKALTRRAAEDCDLVLGDKVKVDLPLEIVKTVTEEEVGWMDEMTRYLGKVGLLKKLTAREATILFDDGEAWNFPRNLVSKAQDHEMPNSKAKDTKSNVSETQFKTGDVVRVVESEHAVKQPQANHCTVENSTARQCCDMVGHVLDVNASGEVEVWIEEKSSTFLCNPATLRLETQTVDQQPMGKASEVWKGTSCHSSGVKADLLREDVSQYDEEEAKRMIVTSATRGQVQELEALLEMFPHMVDCKCEGHTGLHQACHHGHADAILSLLHRGASLTAQDFQGYTPLHHAAYGNDYTGSTAKLLITVREDIDLNDARNEPCKTTPLALAVSKNNVASAAVLIGAGCNVNAQDGNGLTPLHSAVLLGDMHMVHELLKAPSINLKICDNQRMNPFLSAVNRKFDRAVEAMVTHSPNIVSVPEFGSLMTALHFSAVNDDVEIALILLQTEKCDTRARNKNGQTALEQAISAESSSVMELLSSLETGAETRCSFQKLAPGNHTKCQKGDVVLCVGDRVRLVDDKGTLEVLQMGHGGYTFHMNLNLGKQAIVTDILPGGDVRISTGLGHQFVMNPAALELVASQQENLGFPCNSTSSGQVESWTSGNPPSGGLNALIFEMMEEMRRILRPNEVVEEDHVRLLFYAVVTNRLKKVKEILGVLPDQVNCQLEKRTPLHLAGFDGSAELVELLLDSKADVNAKDNNGFLPLHYSAFGDRSGKTAQILVSSGSEVNSHDNTHQATPAGIAVLRSNEAVLTYLVEVRCDLNLQDRFGDTPLHDAVRTENVSIANLLLRTPDVNPHIYNNEGLNPFLIAVKCGNEALVRSFTQEAPGILEILAEDGSVMTALHLACLHNHSGTAEILMDTNLCDIRALDGNNRTPLDLANQNNMHAVVRRLREMQDTGESSTTVLEACSIASSTPETFKAPTSDGAGLVRTVNVRDVEILVQGAPRVDVAELPPINNEKKPSRSLKKSVTEGQEENDILENSSEQNEGGPLIEDNSNSHPGEELLKATIIGHLSRVKTLVQSNPEMIDYRPRHFTALHLACQSGFSEIIEYLIERGASREMQEGSELTPLHAAAVHDKSGKAAATLLEFSVEVNTAAQADGFTALHLAVLRDNQATATVLIQGGCETNLTDSEGNTPLHHAIAHENNELVDVIVQESSCQPLIRNHRGLNAIQLATESGNVHAIEKLTEKYSDCINEPTENGSTPLHLAVATSNVNIVKAILQKNVEVNLRDNNNKTALALAVGMSDEIVDLLLEKGASFETFGDPGEGFATC